MAAVARGCLTQLPVDIVDLSKLAAAGAQPDDVAVAQFCQRAAIESLGLDMDRGGNLADAPDMRPSVTSATAKPSSCSTPSEGVSLCSSGMPFARGP